MFEAQKSVEVLKTKVTILRPLLCYISRKGNVFRIQCIWTHVVLHLYFITKDSRYYKQTVIFQLSITFQFSSFNTVFSTEYTFLAPSCPRTRKQ